MRLFVEHGDYLPFDKFDDPNCSFRIRNGIFVFGGFNGEEETQHRKRSDLDGNRKIEPWEFEYPTIFNGQGKTFHVAKVGGNLGIPEKIPIEAKLDGVTVTGGMAIGTEGEANGGGIFMTEGYLDSCIIKGNQAAGLGAGIYSVVGIASDKSIISCCYLLNNSTGQNGGGIAFNEALDRDDYETAITNSCLEGNIATENGGAIFCALESSVVDHNSIINNNASTGAGIYIYQANNAIGIGTANITNNLIANNSSSNTSSGACLFYKNNTADNVDIKISSNTIVNNYSTNTAGVLIDGNSERTNAEYIKFLNNIVWGNSGAQQVVATSIDDFTSSNNAYAPNTVSISVTGTYTTDGTIEMSETSNILPQFVAPSLAVGTIPSESYMKEFDWSLMPSSPLIDAGIIDSKNQEDLAGNQRVFLANPDIGAYEYQSVVGSGYCAEITGNGFIHADSQGADITSDYALECWVMPTSLPDQTSTVLAYHYTYDPTQLSFGIFQSGNSFQILHDGSKLATISNIAINKWYHLAVSINRSNNAVSVYVNGILFENIQTQSLELTNDYSLFIGGSGKANSTLPCKIDEVRVWNRALDSGDIFANLHKLIEPTSLDLVAYYQFDQADFISSVADATGNDTAVAENGTNIGVTPSNALLSPFIRTIHCPDSVHLEAQWDSIPSSLYEYSVITSKSGKVIEVTKGTTTQASIDIPNLTERTTYTLQIVALQDGKSSEPIKETTTTPFAPPGNAISLNGKDQCVKIPETNLFGGAFTVSAWMKLSSHTGVKQLANFIPPTGLLSFGLSDHEKNGIYFLYYNASSATEINSEYTLPLDQWCQISYTYDGANFRIYVNGAMIIDTVANLSGIKETLFNEAYIGKGNGFTDLTTDEFAIYSQALKQEEIQAQINKPIALDTEGLELYYSFDNLYGSTVYDRTGKTGNGTLVPGDEIITNNSLALKYPITKSLTPSPYSIDVEWYTPYRFFEDEYAVSIADKNGYSVDNFPTTSETKFDNLQPETKYYITINYQERGRLCSYTDSIATLKSLPELELATATVDF